MRRWTDWTIVAGLLLPPWVLALVAGYWLYLAPAPIELVAQYPQFLAWPVASFADADAAAVSEVTPGAQVWILREWCQRTDRVIGETQSEWLATAASFVWPAPARPIPDLGPGCYVRAAGLLAPNSIPRDYEYLGKWHVVANPLRDDVIEMPPLRLKVR